MEDFGQSLQVRNISYGFFFYYCCSVNLNVGSCLTEAVIHHRFRLQQENLTETAYRKLDPNRNWEVKTDSRVFLTGRAEIKHIFG